MSLESILYVFNTVMAYFDGPLTVLFGAIVAAVGLRWIIKVFVR